MFSFPASIYQDEYSRLGNDDNSSRFSGRNHLTQQHTAAVLSNLKISKKKKKSESIVFKKKWRARTQQFTIIAAHYLFSGAKRNTAEELEDIIENIQQ